MENSTKKIWGISIFNSMAKMLIMSVLFFWAIFYNSIGFSGTQIGIIFAIYSITALITVAPSGFINDRLKSRDLVSISLLLLATQFIGVSMFQGFIPVILFAILGGIGNNLYVVSIESLFYKSTEKTNVQGKIAIFQSILYFFMGAAIIGSGQLLNLNIPFTQILLWGGIGFATLAIISRLLPKSVTTDLQLVEYKKDIFQPKVIFLLIVAFLFSLHYGPENTSYGLFLTDTLGLSKYYAGLYMGSAIMIMGFFSIIFANALKKIQPKYLLFFSLLLSGFGHIFMTVEMPIYSYIFRVIHEIGDAGMFVFLAYGILSFFKAERLGGNNGIINFVVIIGTALSNIISGPLGEKFGYNISLIAGGIALLVALILSFIFNRLIVHKELQQ